MIIALKKTLSYEKSDRKKLHAYSLQTCTQDVKPMRHIIPHAIKTLYQI